jgi:hypothetical protein
VQRGHWSFGTGNLARGFTPNPSTAVVNLWDVSTADLDANTNFINAVKVTARREDTPIYSYFARIFNIESWAMQATAVAYIGFAGALMPQEVDQPIAICKESLLIDGKYTCSTGRMINSGQNVATSETGGWTDFNQVNACNGGTNASTVKGLVCGAGNPEAIQFGVSMATNGGDITSAFGGLYDCWTSKTAKTDLWKLTLPVVECNDNNLGPCNKVVGAVTLNIVWILEKSNKIDDDAPYQMGDGWQNTSPDGITRWNDFVEHFNLRKPDGEYAFYSSDPQSSGFMQKAIYFLPDCTVHEPAGATGGENYGVLAKIPVLVH